MRYAAPLALALLAASTPAVAGLSELRFGVLAHDVDFLGHGKEDGADVNAELLFDSPAFLEAVWAPRPHAGVSVNTQGDTSQFYGGLTWTWEPVDRLFVDFSFGGAIHDGKLSYGGYDRKELGSRVLFRESLSLGWRFDERNSLSVYFDHESNANLASSNEGLNNFGIRWGYKF